MQGLSKVVVALAVAAGTVMLGGCGGGSGASASVAPSTGSASPGSVTVQGVSTPSSVAVVTATNAD